MPQKTPLISVVTVCLNEPNLERTCESIVNQTFQDFEWIVIDGGSNDATLAIFEKYRLRIDHFLSEPDNGIYSAMNKGIDRAQGVWLNFMNAGDSFVHASILAKLFACGEHIANCDILYGDHLAGDSNIVVKAPAATKKEFYSKIICSQAAFIRTAILKNNFLDEGYKICADWNLMYQLLLKNYRFKQLNIAIARFYENGISHTNPKDLFADLSRVRSQYYSQEESAAIKKELALLVRKRMTNV